MTGPAFLPGLQKECDERLAGSVESSRAYRIAQTKRDALHSARVNALRDNAPFLDQPLLDAANAALERAAALVDDASRGLRSVAALAAQSAELAKAARADRLALLATPEGALAIGRARDTDPGDGLLAALCREAALYQRSEPALNDATIWSMRFLGETLSSLGEGQRVGHMDNLDVQSAVASQAMKWLLLRIGGGSGASLGAVGLSLIAAQAGGAAPLLLLEGPAVQAFSNLERHDKEDT